jgi:hypothetical protein
MPGRQPPAERCVHELDVIALKTTFTAEFVREST